MKNKILRNGFILFIVLSFLLTGCGSSSTPGNAQSKSGDSITLSAKYFYNLKITCVKLKEGDDGWYEEIRDYFIFESDSEYSVYHRNKKMFTEKYEVKEDVAKLNFPDGSFKTYTVTENGKVLVLDAAHKYVRKD